MDKTQLRKVMLAKRSRMPLTQAADASKRITNRLMNEVDWSGVAHIHIYTAIDGLNEVQTDYLINALQINQPDIAITKGVPSKSAKLPTEKFDVVIVPLLAFTRGGDRLGYGGGWYDKFLSSQSHALMIGLGYEFQLVESLTAEAHDMQLTMIVSDEHTYR